MFVRVYDCADPVLWGSLWKRQQEEQQEEQPLPRDEAHPGTPLACQVTSTSQASARCTSS